MPSDQPFSRQPKPYDDNYENRSPIRQAVGIADQAPSGKFNITKYLANKSKKKDEETETELKARHFNLTKVRQAEGDAAVPKGAFSEDEELAIMRAGDKAGLPEDEVLAMQDQALRANVTADSLIETIEAMDVAGAEILQVAGGGEPGADEAPAAEPAPELEATGGDEPPTLEAGSNGTQI